MRKIFTSFMFFFLSTAYGADTKKFVEAFTELPLKQYDSEWKILADYYGDFLPNPIYVVYTQGWLSKFSYPNKVILSLKSYGIHPDFSP